MMEEPSIIQMNIDRYRSMLNVGLSKEIRARIVTTLGDKQRLPRCAARANATGAGLKTPRLENAKVDGPPSRRSTVRP